MAKKETTPAPTSTEYALPEETEVGLTVRGDGVLMPDASMSNFIAEGFSEERIIKIGDPKSGTAVAAYIGELIGPGPDLELSEAFNRDGKTQAIPTWCFHPLDSKTLKPITAVTHTLLCPNQLDSACKKLQSIKLATNKRVQGVFMWTGKGTNRLGQPLNLYRCGSRLLNDDGTPHKVGG